jgi:hypothetical protein
MMATAAAHLNHRMIPSSGVHSVVIAGRHPVPLGAEDLRNRVIGR